MAITRWEWDKRWRVNIDGRKWCGAYDRRGDAIQGAMLADANAARLWDVIAPLLVSVEPCYSDCGAKKVHRCE